MHVNGPEALRYPNTHGLVLRRAVVARAERRGGAWAGVRRRAPPDALRGVATRAGPKAGLPIQGQSAIAQIALCQHAVSVHPPRVPSSVWVNVARMPSQEAVGCCLHEMLHLNREGAGIACEVGGYWPNVRCTLGRGVRFSMTPDR